MLEWCYLFVVVWVYLESVVLLMYYYEFVLLLFEICICLIFVLMY